MELTCNGDGEQYRGLSNKRPKARYGLPLLDLLVGGVSETPKCYRLLLVFLLVTLQNQNQKVRPYC